MLASVFQDMCTSPISILPRRWRRRAMSPPLLAQSPTWVRTNGSYMFLNHHFMGLGGLLWWHTSEDIFDYSLDSFLPDPHQNIHGLKWGAPWRGDAGWGLESLPRNVSVQLGNVCVRLQIPHADWRKHTMNTDFSTMMPHRTAWIWL